MRFSVIIPTHNAAGHIRKVLDSVKQQTFKDYELIVVCDSCTDNTKEIAEEYGAKVYEVENNCDGPTRSKGLDVAQGEYVLFLDDDDWWLHEYVLDQLNKKLKENPTCDLLCFSFIFRGKMYAGPLSNGGNLWPAVWNKCWRRAFIGDTRFPNVHAISDWYFHQACMSKSPKKILWDMPMYYYNWMREGSISEVDKKKGVKW